MQKLSFVSLLAIVLSAPLCAAGLEKGLATIQAQTISAHIKQLASDEFEGRAPGTRGEKLTINYLAEQFRRASLAPGNPDGTYFQKVPMIGYRSAPQIEIIAGGQKTELKFLDDFVHDTVALRPSASVKNAGVVFAGYGIMAPAFGWDDYKNVDVRNKLVIVLAGEPSRPNPGDSTTLDPAFFKGETRTYFSTREAKFDLAAAKGAAGILIVMDPEKSHTYSVFQTFAKMEGCALEPHGARTPTLISGLVTIGAARRVVQLAGMDFDQLEAAATRADSHAVLLNATSNLSVRSELRHFVSHNVVARVAGSDAQLKNEYVVYSAHWDHLGKDPNLEGDQIYNGAIDDAAGIAQLLEIARGFAALPQKPRRSILFVATTGEEKGFLGSRFYAQHPLFPLAKTLANINLDGGNVWGITADLISTGYGLSTLDETLAHAARMQGRKFINEPIDNGGLYFASDQIEFAKVGIPAAFPFSGSEYVGRPKEFADEQWGAYSKNDYHQVSDEWKPDWDLSGAVEDAKWLMIAGDLVADGDQRPQWKIGSEFARH